MTGSLNLHPKVSAALLASWVTTIVFFCVQQWAGFDVPVEVGAAATSLVGFAAGWLAPSAVASDYPVAAAPATWSGQSTPAFANINPSGAKGDPLPGQPWTPDATSPAAPPSSPDAAGKTAA